MHLSVVRPQSIDAVRDPLAQVLAGETALAVIAPDQDPVVVLPDQPAEAGTLVLATSGSTGAPKAVTLSASALRASATMTGDHLGEPTDWMCALPVHHIAGLMTVVRAQVMGTSAVAVSSRLTDLPRPTRPSAVSLVPTQLVRALAIPEVVSVLAAYTAVLVGGAASAPELVARARASGIPVITTYGMTETCGGCVYDGVPLPGVEVAVDSDQRILLGGPMVFSNYRGDAELTSQVLVDGHVRTQDRGRLSEGRLEVLGRLDEVVISGGVNVDLAAVGRVVSLVDPETVVIGLPDPEWGAVITLVTTRPRDLQWWQVRLRPALTASALPRRIEVVDSLPLTSSGKVDRRRLVAELSSRLARDLPGSTHPDQKETRGNAR